MDNQIFTFINSFAGRNFWLDKLGIFFGVYVIYFLAVGSIVAWLDKKLRPRVYLAALSVFVSRVIVVQMIKIIIDRPRPFETLPVNLLVDDTGSGRAFTSGHAVILFAIAFSFYKTKLFWPFLILAFLGSVARIFIGVHYPSDVLVSALIAWLTVWTLMGLFKKQLLS